MVEHQKREREKERKLEKSPGYSSVQYNGMRTEKEEKAKRKDRERERERQRRKKN